MTQIGASQQKTLNTNIQEYYWSDNMIKCKECLEEKGESKEFKSINWMHLKHKHNMTVEEYKEKYPNAPIISEGTHKKLVEANKGENNPYYKNGDYSPYIGRYECPYCGNRYKTIPALMSHWGHKHPNKPRPDSYKPELNGNYKHGECVENKNDYNIDCPYCDKKCKSKYGRYIHCIESHPNKPKPEYKPKCNPNYRHGEKSNREVKCPYCDKVLSSKERAWEHYQKYHNDKPEIYIRCKECGKLYRNITSSHLRKVHNITPDEYIKKYPNSETYSELYSTRISKANTGHSVSEEQRKKISKANTGHSVSEEARKKISKGIKERIRNSDFQSNLASKYYVDKLGHSVRSTWEEIIGKSLNKNEIEYDYEKCFKVEYNGHRHNFFPDFVFDHIVVEPHGFIGEGDREKFKAFHNQHPNYKFIILSNEECSDVCDVYIPWRKREELINIIDGENI